jgi:hypothetical protein
MACDLCIEMDLDDGIVEQESCEVGPVSTLLTCGECYRAIEPGQVAEVFSGTFEQEECEYITCSVCLDVREHFYCGSWVFGSIWEEIEERCFGELTTASECFQKLSAEAKAYTLERWRKWKFAT